MEIIKVSIVTFEDLLEMRRYDEINNLFELLSSWVDQSYGISVIREKYSGTYDELTLIKPGDHDHLKNFIRQFIPQ